MKGKIRRHLGIFLPCYLYGAVYLSQIGIPLWWNSKFRELGEGYSVRETRNKREFYLGGQGAGARICIDKDKDGNLDYVLKNAPVSPMIGGPGYRLMETKTTEEDSRKFERANYLYNLMKGGYK